MSSLILGNLPLMLLTVISVTRPWVNGESTAHIWVTKSHASPGENANVTCDVRDIAGAEFVQWFKRIKNFSSAQGDKNPYIYQKIGTNTQLELMFSKRGRYQITKSEKGTVMLLTLVIKGIQKEDNGTIGCAIIKGSTANLTGNKYDTVDLTVLSSPESIRYMPKSRPLNLTEGRVGKMLRCDISGSTTLPSFEIFLGHNNITDRFETTVKNEPACSDHKRCIIYSEVNVQAAATKLYVMPEDDGVNLTCRAWTGKKSNGLRVSVPVQVTYKPKIKRCLKSYPVSLNNKATIMCMIQGNPPVTSVYWEFSINGKSIRLKADQDQDGVRVRRDYIQGNIYSRLTIGKAERKHLGVYTVVANNEMGTGQKAIDIYDKNGGASSITENQSKLPHLTLLILHIVCCLLM